MTEILETIATVLQAILRILEEPPAAPRPALRPAPSGRKRGRPRTIMTDIKTYKAMKQREYYAKRKAARKADWQMPQ